MCMPGALSRQASIWEPQEAGTAGILGLPGGNNLSVECPLVPFFLNHDYNFPLTNDRTKSLRG